MRNHANLSFGKKNCKPPFAVSTTLPMLHSEVLILLHAREGKATVATHLAVDKVCLAVSDSDYVRWLPCLVLSQIVTPKAFFKEDFAELSFKIVAELLITHGLSSLKSVFYQNFSVLRNNDGVSVIAVVRVIYSEL